MDYVSFKSLTQPQKELLDAAEEIMYTAYSPYSHFYVGAAFRTKTGKIITGSNVENASYGNTICAERAAIIRANAMGERIFTSLAVIGKGEDYDCKEAPAPCGACRQTIFEASQLSKVDLEIILANTKRSKIIITSIKQLLPLAFGPDDLGIDLNSYRKM